jgi:teichuronic acid biosynthesis glycosyltransferase TuaH
MRPVVILSTADFNAAVWTNKQHLAVRLAEHTQVSYIESIGLRAVQPSIADIKRVHARLFRATPKAPGRSGRLSVVKPHVVPFHGIPVIRAMNRRAFSSQVGRLVAAMEDDPILWTFSPVTYGIERYFTRTVYHSVDKLHTLPHLPARFILDCEKALMEHADTVIASSTGVQRHLESLSPKSVLLWENVADTALYSSIQYEPRQTRAVFAGNLTATKVDFPLLERLATSGIEIVLAGPRDIDGTQGSSGLENLLRHPGVTYMGNLDPTALARLLNTCTVGLIPYLINDYTSGVFPMKVYEYLASGLAVASTPLPSLNHIADQDVQVVAADSFVRAVTESLFSDEDAIRRRRERAGSHTWEMRTREALALLDGTDPGEG